MSLITLDAARLDGSIGALKRHTNEETIELVAELATVLVDSGDSNELIEQGKEAGMKFQTQYNAFNESVGLVITEAKKLIDLDDYLAKFDAGQVTSRDLSFEVKKADTARIIQ